MKCGSQSDEHTRKSLRMEGQDAHVSLKSQESCVAYTHEVAMHPLPSKCYHVLLQIPLGITLLCNKELRQDPIYATKDMTYILTIISAGLHRLIPRLHPRATFRQSVAARVFAILICFI